MFRRMTRERYLSDDELRAFMAAVRGRRHVHQPRDLALFALLANTGLRPSEVRALVRRDCHLRGATPWLALHRPQKAHGPRQLEALYINKAIAEIVRAHVMTLEGDNPKLFPFTKRQSARLFHYYSNKAGIVPRRRVYDLRHSVGMRLWRHTHDLRIMQAVLGHSNLSATAGYSHTPTEAIRSAYERVDASEANP